MYNTRLGGCAGGGELGELGKLGKLWELWDGSRERRDEVR